MPVISGYAGSYIEDSGTWSNPGNVTGAPDTAEASYNIPAHDVLGTKNFPGFSSLPSDVVISNIKVIIRHRREGGAVVSGTPLVEAALSVGGTGPYGDWISATPTTSLADWTIDGPPSTYGLSSIPPHLITSEFGVVYRRALLADEVPQKTRYIDSVYLEITYNQPQVADGGTVLSGAAYFSGTQNPTGGVALSGVAPMQPSLPQPEGGVILGGSAELCRYSREFMDNCDAGVLDVRVRGAHTDRIENWYRCSKTGMWYPASRIRTVNGVIMGDDMADEPLRFPQGLDEE